ncbi:MAG TPA: NAD(P)-dependent oxidoreductase [Actinophytocola sp.]|uniref:NAD-dependent epimerase/dehydratase family protein n=1 Tax=Actinophytocola sp. TaxID=1872138 RepID=UPI002DB5D825|nr:NAD(P)-dependent oxidoreductase [Actinophytocola sp.]HEU5472637.1 NAD(P)-dependent oxidoreductase [Actinophytocola sp.]
MRILLTGSTGNVGSHVLPALRQRGHAVRTFALPRQDVTDPHAVAAAVAGVDAVVHLAAMIPPAALERPDRARAVNVDGTANVIAACRSQPRPPRLLFTSTFDVHGRTMSRPPPRRVDDPLVATDPYTAHKIECERLVRESELDWAIFRLTDVPVLGARAPHPIMFEIGLDNRIEAVHAADAALAVAAALETPAVWGRVLFVGGGPSCQLSYREYLARLLAAMGLDPLPDSAFRDAEYVTDWVDSTESEALLHYQRHTFDDIAAAVARGAGWRRPLARAVRPLARRALLRLSPYHGRR